MSKSTSRSLPLFTVVMVVGGLTWTGACGGNNGLKEFGGGETGGATVSSGGRVGTGGEVGAGTGGSVNSGGTPGSGGATATGGMSATGGGGGRANSGGASATGGVTATGGTSATGGRTSTGGAMGTGGHVGTGGMGSGGSTATCDQLAADYQAEMPNARMCNTITGLTVPQCQTMAASSLGCGSSCIVYVQDGSRLAEIQKKWNSADCASTIRVCPAIACVQAKPGNCYASTVGGPAQCQAAPKN